MNSTVEPRFASVTVDDNSRFYKRPLFLLALFVGLFHLVTMPRFYYPGDNFPARAETAHLVTTGEWGIPYSQKDHWKGFLEQKGQYFFENDKRQKLFSKYGVGYTLFYIPPLFIARLCSGSTDVMESGMSQLVCLNVYQTLLSVLALIYLYRIVSFYTGKTWIRIVFVLSSFYATFVWHYLRAPALEIYQILCFLGFYFHFVAFLRGRARGETTAGIWRGLAFAMAWLSFLFLTKVTHGLTFGVAWLFAFLAGPRGTGMVQRVTSNVVRYWRRYLLMLVLPTLATAVFFLATNSYRTGSMFEDGYGQWMRDGEVIASLHVSAIPAALSGLFWNIGQYNVFVTYPVFFFALLGYYRFFKKNCFEAAFMVTVFLASLAVISCLKWWSGSWCYAPRYMILILMVGSLPFVETLDWLTGRFLRRDRACPEPVKEAPEDVQLSLRCGMSFVGLLAITAVLLYSFYMQVCVNSLHYFTCYQITSFLSPVKEVRLDRYWESFRQRGSLNKDIILYGWFGKEYYPIKVLEEVAPPGPETARMLAQVRAFIGEFAKPNYLLVARDTWK